MRKTVARNSECVKFFFQLRLYCSQQSPFLSGFMVRNIMLSSAVRRSIREVKWTFGGVLFTSCAIIFHGWCESSTWTRAADCGSESRIDSSEPSSREKHYRKLVHNSLIALKVLIHSLKSFHMNGGMEWLIMVVVWCSRPTEIHPDFRLTLRDSHERWRSVESLHANNEMFQSRDTLNFNVFICSHRSRALSSHACLRIFLLFRLRYLFAHHDHHHFYPSFLTSFVRERKKCSRSRQLEDSNSPYLDSPPAREF